MRWQCITNTRGGRANTCLPLIPWGFMAYANRKNALQNTWGMHALPWEDGTKLILCDSRGKELGVATTVSPL